MENTEKTDNLFKVGLDMAYLANCALWDVAAQDSVVKAMDLQAVYSMAKKQSMTAVTYYGLEKWLGSQGGKESGMDASLLNKWQQARDMAIRKNTMLDIAREEILTYMEENGIWYMPLKGSILKDMYPRLGMRQMSDNDILIDAAYRRQVYDYMVSHGYEGIYQEDGVHDKYLKKPCYNFEIHNMMVSRNYFPEFAEYYKNVKDRLIPVEGCRYCFRDEDFYIYMMVHAYKHHCKAGIGLRHIMDVRIYLEQKPSLDWGYIRTEFEHLGIGAYDASVRSLANKLFDKACGRPDEVLAKLEPEERNLLGLSIGAGTYGTFEKFVGNDLQNYTQGKQLTAMRKVYYFWKRLTWEGGVRGDFPRLAKYKVLYPLLYVARAIKIVLLRREKLVAEIKVVKNKK